VHKTVLRFVINWGKESLGLIRGGFRTYPIEQEKRGSGRELD